MKKLKFYLVSCLFLGIILVGAIFNFSTNKKTDKEKKVINIGVLQLLNHESLDTIYKGIVDGLDKHGYGDKIKINLKNAQGDQSNLELMSKTLISEKNDILVGITTLSTISLSKNTSEIPIVMAGITYPVESGLINSEKSSGNNITGVSDRTPIDKQLELIKEILPNIKKLGILYTIGEDNSVRQVKFIEDYASKLGIEIEKKSLTNTNDINQCAESLAKNVDAIFVPIDNTIASSMNTLISITDKYKIPVFPSSDGMVKDGGLLAIGVDQYSIGLKTSDIIVRILNGEEPKNIPIVFENEGVIYFNEQKAIDLGINLPKHIIEKSINVTKK